MQISNVVPAFRQHAQQCLRYLTGAVGGLGTDWVTWVILITLFGHPVMAQAFGKLAGGIFGFFTYRRFVFQAQAIPPRGQAARFVCAAAASGALSVMVVAILTHWISPVAAKICADGITFVVNYEVMRTLVFRKNRATVA